jgi:hypothetical protein
METLKPMKTIVLLIVWSMFPLFLLSQTKEPQRLSPLETANHVGEQAIVCGQVVAFKISRYSVGNHGKPINFFLDQPETNPVFFFVALSPDPANPLKAKEAYFGKQVCVTGKITKIGNVPDIMVTDRSQIKVKTDDKK